MSSRDENKVLRGQVAVISGGLGDIGRAIAYELAGLGAHIALCDLVPEASAVSFLAELQALGVEARYGRVDVAEPSAVRAWIAEVEERIGTPTLIVPNAAIVTVKPPLELSAEDWSRELRVNLDGSFHLAQICAQRMVQRKLPGRIVFMGSWVGYAPDTSTLAYCVSKAGLRMLMKVLALELAPHGILVNEVAPGYVDAGLSGRFFEKNPALRVAARQRVPVRELVMPADVARQVAQLCVPANKHVTGSVLLMDGGLSLVTPTHAGKNT